MQEKNQVKLNNLTYHFINPEYSLEGLMLKLQYFGHLMQRVDSLEKTLMLGKNKKQTNKKKSIKMVHT